MRKSGARIPRNCFAQPRWRMEKPCMKTISAPSRLPDSSSTISTPSGVVTVVLRRSEETASIGFNHPGETDMVFHISGGADLAKEKIDFRLTIVIQPANLAVMESNAFGFDVQGGG